MCIRDSWKTWLQAKCLYRESNPHAPNIRRIQFVFRAAFSGKPHALHNDSDESQIIEPDERIAQLIVQPYLNVELKEVDRLSDTERGSGEFGSTGK